MDHRTYSQEEIAAMLERAAALQAQQSDKSDFNTGLTFAELEEIAMEAGIDSEHLRQAARELNAPGQGLLDRGSGSNATHIFVDRTIPGSLSQNALEQVVVELRGRFDRHSGTGYGASTTQQIGRSIEWKHTSMAGVESRVLIRPSDDHLRIRLSQRVGLAGSRVESVGYGLFLAIMTAIISGSVTQSGPIGVGLLFAMLFIAVPIIYVADQKWRQKKHRELNELGDRIATLLSDPEAENEPGVAGGAWAWETDTSSSSRIDPSLLDDPASEVPPATPRSRTKQS